MKSSTVNIKNLVQNISCSRAHQISGRCVCLDFRQRSGHVIWSRTASSSQVTAVNRRPWYFRILNDPGSLERDCGCSVSAVHVEAVHLDVYMLKPSILMCTRQIRCKEQLFCIIGVRSQEQLEERDTRSTQSIVQSTVYNIFNLIKYSIQSIQRGCFSFVMLSTYDSV